MNTDIFFFYFATSSSVTERFHFRVMGRLQNMLMLEFHECQSHINYPELSRDLSSLRRKGWATDPKRD